MRPVLARGGWRLAGQMLLFQVGVIVLVVGIGAAVSISSSIRAANTDSRDKVLAISRTLARSPGVVAAARSSDPSRTLQPVATSVQKDTRTSFVVFMSPAGIRFTHPDPARIGGRFLGDIDAARRGKSLTETYEGTLGESVRAVVPIKDDGRVVGLVSVGILLRQVSAQTSNQIPILVGLAVLALAIGTVGSVLLARRVRRQTLGLDPAEIARQYQHNDAVLHAVREGVLIVDGERRLTLANDEARRLLDLPAEAEGTNVDQLGLPPRTAALLASGRVATDEMIMVGDRLLAVNQRRTDDYGAGGSTVVTLRDSTELQALTGKAETARSHLKLLYDAAADIATTLDVTRTAEELVRVVVPRLADFSSVDLVEPVLRGEEPVLVHGLVPVHRVAVHGVRDDHPFFPAGTRLTLPPTTPQAAVLGGGPGVLMTDLRTASRAWMAVDEEQAQHVIDYGIHSLILVPLRARGVLLGMVNFWRGSGSEPFGEEDLFLAQEVVALAALGVDNARRFASEHATAVTLQESLLPRANITHPALEVAHRYLPAQALVGGDWFDVIPLTGFRVALVVGDVVGHGLQATATMGRLRTAIHTLSALDLPPDELLARMDELVTRADQEETARSRTPVSGATCLYAIYDPIGGGCTLARAGQPPPALITPDGSVEFLELPPGPPLGMGAGLRFEAAERQLPEGSRLVLYTDGLVEDRGRDIDVGLDLLRQALLSSGPTPEQTCTEVLETVLPRHPADDVALLVARTRLFHNDQVARWDVEPDPAAVEPVRTAATQQLAEWGLEEAAFTTELLLSELITNAIRYGAPPIQVRLIRNHSLFCEVSDASSTSPHLRYAAEMDEGGRGIFLVAQMAERWGTRHTTSGKIIWAEQALS
ncbi:SpoIIE family protein phosphatase [Streptomyces sp. NBC_01795]|uniref:SpoIIE family protein phosphatase n=1 Tax=unclassified Streptomyces TaxID=2593676 RepID=UPI002DDA0838|nr:MULTISPECIES: SpoIIE family protein phosphatase [unclassified Streptomyces]WSA94909.1 SpoIIE family protein phosphatase [Streptomyces sp. NBC_01795]WSB79329.1 SpoIIE family protein phosphatase [Streptomyces sp. NBC_01775]WSS12465.1 SpoIIE family protein phosphatase [Streptomyces sp. NBC_01186]